MVKHWFKRKDKVERRSNKKKQMVRMGCSSNGNHRHGVHSGSSDDGGYYDHRENSRNCGDREESGQLIPSMTSLALNGDGDAKIGDQTSSFTHGGGRGYVDDGHDSGYTHAGLKRIHGYKDVPPEYINRHNQEARSYSKKRKSCRGEIRQSPLCNLIRK